MAVFGRLFGRRLSKLVTCIVERDGQRWQATWASDGRVPADFSEDSLNACTERAAAEIAILYANQAAATRAELQFAIYPWTSTTAKVILDITKDSDGFVAKDIQGSGAMVRGDSLEVLVREAEQTLPNPHDAMFRWERAISTLQLS